MLSKRRMVTRASCAVAMAVAVVGVAACGSDETSVSGSAPKASGPLDGGGKELVFFSLTSASPYINEMNRVAKREATKLGYKLKVIESPFEPAAQNQQVQQYLASGQKPAAFMIFPFVMNAMANSVRLASRTAPVIMITNKPSAEVRPYVKAYSGVNDVAIGDAIGKLAIEAREEARKRGKKLSSPNGNVILFGFPSGNQADKDRIAGFKEATKDEPFNLLSTEHTIGDVEDGFKVASQVLPKFKSKGIDFIVTLNQATGEGVNKALRANDLTPGKDVIVVAGNCSSNLEPLRRGEIYGASIQSAPVEGKLAVRTTAQYLATGKVAKGEVTVEDTPDTEPELTATPPHEFNYLPNPVVKSGDAVDGIRLWGIPVDKLCFG